MNILNRSRCLATQTLTLVLACLLAATGLALLGGPTAAGAQQAAELELEPLIRVDQFGYLPVSPKVAVFADPVEGFNGDESYSPGNRIELRRAGDGSTVVAGSPTQWNRGRIDPQSGDRGWTFEFTDVQEPGVYYLADVENGVRSYEFAIGSNVYDDVLDAAMKMFWYNRGNVAHQGPLAGPWTDDAAYIGPNQDTEARWIDDPNNPATARDLSGGWFDAGDTNKYVTFANSVVHQLLSSYQDFPQVFDDDAGIPESGNGVPDVVDEVLWEIDWLKKMQNPDGGVLIKVGETEYTAGPVPSEVRLPRFYEEACSSATIAAAGMFAHTAVVLRDLSGFEPEVRDLTRRAKRAWKWFHRNAIDTDCDPGLVTAGDADMSREDQLGETVTAAVYLHELTGAKKFRRAIGRNLGNTMVVRDPGYGRYEAQQGDALAAYLDQPNAKRSQVRKIRREMRRAARNDVVRFAPEAGLYRSYLPEPNIHWGSNMIRANAGSSSALIAAAGVDAANRWQHLDRASTNLQSFHGLNPMGLVYLSNMEQFGSERSASEIYHYWFGEGTPFDSSITSPFGPAPGYLVGGPNPTYSGSVPGLADQPPLKVYLDWNTVENEERSYEITEPSTSYQAAYVRLLASVMVNDQ